MYYPSARVFFLQLEHVCSYFAVRVWSRCVPWEFHQTETDTESTNVPVGSLDPWEDQSERCHDLRPRGDRPFDRNVLLGEYPFQSGRGEQMRHRMQHEERGKQNLQDPQSNVHCMIAFSYIHTVSESVLYV